MGGAPAGNDAAYACGVSRCVLTAGGGTGDENGWNGAPRGCAGGMYDGCAGAGYDGDGEEYGRVGAVYDGDDEEFGCADVVDC